MIINRRTLFTDLEYPNPFEDPGWTDWSDFSSDATLVATANPGQKISYKVPDGASGWYVMKVVPYTTATRNGDWQYTYLHEGSVVELWCNDAASVTGRKSLGADGSDGIGGAAGAVVGFKKMNTIGDCNYGYYKTAEPIQAVTGDMIYRKWFIEFADGRKTVRYTRGTANWDATVSANSAIYIEIDGKPCYSFEDAASIMAAPGVTITEDSQTYTFDGIYLGTVPIEVNNIEFSASAGLIMGSCNTFSSEGSGGGALGSSRSLVGPLDTFGRAPSSWLAGGVAYFDFTRRIAYGLITSPLSHIFTSDSEPAGVTLYKVTLPGHDTTQPYAQMFTAPASNYDCHFEFKINGTPYIFPSSWGPDADDQAANSGEYITYIQGVHIGDELTVEASYSDGTIVEGFYIITMHSLVYGLVLSSGRHLFYTPEEHTARIGAGDWYIIGSGGGGQGGYNGTSGAHSAGGNGGAGGNGTLRSTKITLLEPTTLDVYVGLGGGIPDLTSNNGGLGGNAVSAGGAGGAGGSGALPSYVKIGNTYVFWAEGGGGGGGGGGGTEHGRYAGGGSGGGGGGYFRIDSLDYETSRDIPIYFHINYLDYDNCWFDENPTGAQYNANTTTVLEGTAVSIGQQVYVDGQNSITVADIEGDSITFRMYTPNYTKFYTAQNAIIASTSGGNPWSVIYGQRGALGKTSSGSNNFNGVQGNIIDFPTLRSGDGGEGFLVGHGTGAYGGGASGAGGGGGQDNVDGSWAGAGGGGAGGSDTAGGGQGGYGSRTPYAQDGSHHFTTPIPVLNYLGQATTSGWGIGGASGGYTGSTGWIYIVKAAIISEIEDMGGVMSYEPSETNDAGVVTGLVAQTRDAGAITGTVDDTNDAGPVAYVPTPTVWNLGSITDAVTTIKHCGTITQE